MNKLTKTVICWVIGLGLVFPAAAYAREGDCGYEGGISSGEAQGETSYEYQEVCFISGEPIVFKGTLTIKKSMKQDTITSTYTYSLRNLDKSATLTRTVALSTKTVKKDNGQTVEETALTGKPVESVKIGDTTYTLRTYDFTRSNLIDSKPAINYYAGNTQGRKVYQVGTGTNAGTVTVDYTGNFYGYDQFWGSAQVQIINYVIQSERKKDQKFEKWGGTASVRLSSSMTKQLRYVENEPQYISFEGGFVQSQHNSSILEYASSLPEFDSKGNATDNLIAMSGSLKLETFPAQTRLLVPNLNHLRGHWAENDIKILYGLEIFKGNEASFNPQQYMTRGEFTAAIVQAAKEVPADPALTGRTTAAGGTNSKTGKKETESPFLDVSYDSIYFEPINSAYKRGLISGRGDGTFGKDDLLTFADALTVFIRALGLENLAPGDDAVTTFKDNDSIPAYARKAAYVAERIGLARGDERGYLRPSEKLTKGRAAALINRFINYMREGISKDYRGNIVNY